MCPLAKLCQTIFILLCCLVFVVFFPAKLVNAYGKHIDRFSHPEIFFYKQLLFDVSNYKLLVGARDYIVTLGLEFDSSAKRVYYLPSDQTKQYNCQIKGMKKEQCHNFITALLPIQSNYREKQILVCGTNSYSPECELRPLSSMDTITSRSAPINSFSPTWNTTSLITSTGEFFYGGPLDLRGIDSSITRQQIALTATSKSSNPKDKRIIRSAQHDSKWINSDANFVHSFEYQSHVYFLFRESAVEYLNCGKRIYSRIGRVCKNDPGMVKAAATTWSSFLKSRLNCSIPGLFPFYFDEIQSVDFIESASTLYAIFNTPENSIHGSAVCAFNINSILDTFQGPFKYQKSSNYVWESTSDNRDAFECGASSNQSSTYHNGYGLNSKTYQLMDRAVPSINERPHVISKTEHFKFIAVDVLNLGYQDSVEVLFVVTRDGKLMKYVRWPTLANACLVDEIQLINPKEDQILSMKFLKDTLSLYFGTEKEVLRVPVHRCHVYHNKERCMASNDPYCGWNISKMKCTKAPGNNYKADGWLQPKTPQCSSEHWGKWFTCNQHDSSKDESCKCRKRPCSTLNSETCTDGYELEVANCTMRGGWSEWSEWSLCSPSCGKASTQYRTRACTNPSPMFNGQPCEGSNKEVRDCGNLPSCNWSPWSDWSNCSQVCTPELRRRTRKCVDFEGNLVDESYCLGTYVETSVCDNCKKFDWTNWFITEINDDEIIEQRNEVASHENNIMPKNEKRVITMKYCSKCEGYTYNFKDRDYLIKECGCSGIEEWSDWSEWSRCVNGSQARYRSCMLTEKACSGHYQESRHCSFHLMQSNAGPLEPLVKAGQHQSNIMIILICVFISVIVSSCLTWIIATVLNKRRDALSGSGLGLMKHTSSEPNTYEEPEKYRLNPSPQCLEQQARHATLTRSSTIKRDFSFRAKLDDSNYN